MWRREEVAVLLQAWREVSQQLRQHQSTAGALEASVGDLVTRRFHELLDRRGAPTAARPQLSVERKMQGFWFTFHCVLEFWRRRALLQQQGITTADAGAGRGTDAYNWFMLTHSEQRAHFAAWDGDLNNFIEMDADMFAAMLVITDTQIISALAAHHDAPWSEAEVDALVLAWRQVVTETRATTSATATTNAAASSVTLRPDVKAICSLLHASCSARSQASVEKQLRALVTTYRVICRYNEQRSARRDWFSFSMSEQKAVLQLVRDTRLT